MQQVRQAWCDGNQEINESRGTLIRSELISNRGCDTINLLPLSVVELHLSLSSFHAPLPLWLFSLTYALCLFFSHLRFVFILLIHCHFTPQTLLDLLCPFHVTLHVSHFHSQWIMYFRFYLCTPTYTRFISRIREIWY